MNIITKLKEEVLMNWLISANGKKYEHMSAFEKWGYIDWRQNKNKFSVGDYVFIYATVPIQKILYKCRVDKINMNSNEIENDSEFWKDKSEYKKSLSGKFMRLELLKSTYSDLLGLEKLVENGLKVAPQGPMKLMGDLDKYICNCFEEIDSTKLQRFLFCNVAYMKNYNGITCDDRPSNGGSYIVKTGDALEKNNFTLCDDGIFRGFVETKNSKGYASRAKPNSIHIERIDPFASHEESINNVMVVFCAKKRR